MGLEGMTKVSQKSPGRSDKEAKFSGFLGGGGSKFGSDDRFIDIWKFLTARRMGKTTPEIPGRTSPVIANFATKISCNRSSEVCMQLDMKAELHAGCGSHTSLERTTLMSISQCSSKKEPLQSRLRGSATILPFGCAFLLTIEVFLLTVRLFYLRWGNCKQKRPNPMSGRGGTVSKKRPNLISGRRGTVSKKDQTDFPL